MMTIEMPAVEQTRSVGPRNRVLDGGAHWRHLASAMRPYVNLLWPIVRYCHSTNVVVYLCSWVLHAVGPQQ